MKNFKTGQQSMNPVALLVRPMKPAQCAWRPLSVPGACEEWSRPVDKRGKVVSYAGLCSPEGMLPR